MITRVTMQRVMVILRRLLLGGLLLLPWTAQSKNIASSPDGLPARDVKDLAYGDVLFYFYQDDYFDAITRLLAARERGRVPNTEGEAELLLGGLYLSLGQHVEAGRIFQALLDANVSEGVRNKAWFYLGKVWYQRGYLAEAERALGQVSQNLQPRVSAERYMLLAQLMLRQGRYDDAIATLNGWRGPSDWTAYAQFNLGVALVRAGRLADAIPHLDRVGRLNTVDEELLALRDRANLALGFALLQAQRAAEARPILERIRLDGPSSSKALLAAGWADSAQGQFKRALVPWLALRKKSLLDSAVQESYLTVPYAYNQLGATGQAAEFYTSAIESFDAEMKRIDAAIQEIRAGSLLDRLLGDDKKDSLTWYWQLKTLPDAPESRYLYQLLAKNEFQEGLKNYRELSFMMRNLEEWHANVAVFDDILETQQTAQRERTPKAEAVLASTDLGAFAQKRVAFKSRLDRIEKTGDVAALGTAEEQATWTRLELLGQNLAQHPNEPALAEMRDKQRLLKGVMYWRLSQAFPKRLANERQALQELDTALAETRQRSMAVQQAEARAPGGTLEFAARVAKLRARMGTLQARLAVASKRQNEFLQVLAIRELEAQKQRIGTYQIQARYELAAIYDKASSDRAKAQP